MSEDRFNEIVADFREFAKKLEIDDITYIPISALKGDNVVSKTRLSAHSGLTSDEGGSSQKNRSAVWKPTDRSETNHMEWYNGPTLLHHLETVKVDASRNVIDFRFPVQYVIRPNQNFRGFSGQISSGRIKPGDEITALPSKMSSRVKEIVTKDGNLDEALAGDSVVLTLEDEIDISRGDMIVRKNNVPEVTSGFEAYLCWMNEEAMETGRQYMMMHTTKTTPVFIDKLIYKMNVDTLSREDADKLQLNEIGRAKFRTAQPLFIDAYQVNQRTGSFVIIDPASNVTVAAGMIRSSSTESNGRGELTKTGTETPPYQGGVLRGVSLQTSFGNPGTSPAKSAKNETATRRKFSGLPVFPAQVRAPSPKSWRKNYGKPANRPFFLMVTRCATDLMETLGFSPHDRTENIRRVGEVARLFFEHGNIVLCTFVSPYNADRDAIREKLPDGRFVEVHVTCDPKTAQERDPKGLYEKAKKGEIKGLTGYDGTYEEPENAEFVVNTDESLLRRSLSS